MNKRRRRKLLLRKAVAERLGVTPRVVSSLVSRGIIPAPTYLDACRPAWVEDEIDALIEERIASRDTGFYPPGRDEVIASRKRGGAKRAAMLRKESEQGKPPLPTKKSGIDAVAVDAGTPNRRMKCRA